MFIVFRIGGKFFNDRLRVSWILVTEFVCTELEVYKDEEEFRVKYFNKL